MRALAVACVVASLAFSSGCSDKRPVKIGYVGGITGHLADLGVSGRDGALLAVEAVNTAGGINGRQLELVIKDDRNNPAEATKVDEELVKEGVAAIIGHMTSAMSLAGAPVATNAGIMMLSPTTSSNDLTGKDDFFLRIYPASSQTATRLATYARQDLKLKRIAIICDYANKSHTLGWYKFFTAAFTGAGGHISYTHDFESSKQMDIGHFIKEVIASSPDGIFILAGAQDTAIICQNLKKAGLNVPILVSEWSTTDELLALGGPAVEGIAFFQHFDRNKHSPEYRDFLTRYEQRFRKQPTFPAVLAYEAVLIAADALKKTDQPRQVKDAVLGTGKFQGLQGDIIIDRYGDATRDAILMTIKNGMFVRGGS